MWKPVVPLILLSNCCRNDSLHRRAKINTAHSTARVQHIVYRAVWLCLVATGAKLCLERSTFKVHFMALDKDLTHATMLNSFAQDVWNSSQNKNWCTCKLLYTCTPTWNFSFIWRLLLFQSTAHSTLNSLKCGIMPCLMESNSCQMRNYAVSSSLRCGIMPCVPPRTMHCFNFVTCLAWLFLFFHINKIHLVNAPTEWGMTNVIGIIKVSWRHSLTNQLSLYVQRPAIWGPR